MTRPAGLELARGVRRTSRPELETGGAGGSRRELARPAGLEPATPGLEGRCSIRLSYGRKRENGTRQKAQGTRQGAGRFDLSHIRQRAHGPRRPRGGNPLVGTVREATLEVHLDGTGRRLDVPGPILELRAEQELDTTANRRIVGARPCRFPGSAVIASPVASESLSSDGSCDQPPSPRCKANSSRAAVFKASSPASGPGEAEQAESALFGDLALRRCEPVARAPNRRDDLRVPRLWRVQLERSHGQRCHLDVVRFDRRPDGLPRASGRPATVAASATALVHPSPGQPGVRPRRGRREGR